MKQSPVLQLVVDSTEKPAIFRLQITQDDQLPKHGVELFGLVNEETNRFECRSFCFLPFKEGTGLYVLPESNHLLRLDNNYSVVGKLDSSISTQDDPSLVNGGIVMDFSNSCSKEEIVGFSNSSPDFEALLNNRFSNSFQTVGQVTEMLFECLHPTNLFYEMECSLSSWLRPSWLSPSFEPPTDLKITEQKLSSLERSFANQRRIPRIPESTIEQKVQDLYALIESRIALSKTQPLVVDWTRWSDSRPDYEGDYLCYYADGSMQIHQISAEDISEKSDEWIHFSSYTPNVGQQITHWTEIDFQQENGLREGIEWRDWLLSRPLRGGKFFVQWSNGHVELEELSRSELFSEQKYTYYGKPLRRSYWAEINVALPQD